MPGPVRADGLFFACAKSKIKSTHKGVPPYVSPRRVPAFGWVETTRMSVPAPTCFLPRQGILTRPGLCRKTPLHSARPDWRTKLAGEGSLRLAVRAESLGSEGRCFGLEANGHCHDWASTTATEESPARDCSTAASASRTKFLYELLAPAMACTCETSPPASRNCAP